MKNILLIIAAGFMLFSCEESFVKDNDEFYNQSLTEQIRGYETWAKEAEEYANENNWAQKIIEPLIGYLDVEYYKKEKSNTNIALRLNYILDVNQAIKTLDSFSDSVSIDKHKTDVQTGFWFIQRGAGGVRVYQTWLVSYDSLLAIKNRNQTLLRLNYERYQMGSGEFRASDGTLSILNLNSVHKNTVFVPGDEVEFYSSYGLEKSNDKRKFRNNLLGRKLKDICCPGI